MVGWEEWLKKRFPTQDIGKLLAMGEVELRECYEACRDVYGVLPGVTIPQHRGPGSYATRLELIEAILKARTAHLWRVQSDKRNAALPQDSLPDAV